MVITSTTGNRVAANTARGFESLLLRHVGASAISLAPTFLQKSERAHSAAPPLQTGPAYPQGARRIRRAAEPPTAAQALGSGLGLGAVLAACASFSATIHTSEQAPYRLLRIFYLKDSKQKGHPPGCPFCFWLRLYSPSSAGGIFHSRSSSSSSAVPL